VLVAAGHLLTLAFVPPDRRPRRIARARRGTGRSWFAPGLLASRALVTAHLCALLLGVNQFVAYSLLPRLAVLPPAEHGFGTTVTGAALILLPGTLVVLPASWATGPLERWLGVRAPLLSGLVVTAAGSGLLAAWHGGVWQVVTWYVVCSVGYGLAMAALPRLVNLVAPAAHSGGANGANTVARVLGGALGSQLAAAVAVTGVSGFPLAFLLATASAALGALFALLRTREWLGSS
jgi:MFS family permease